MATTVSYNGTNYTVPQSGDSGWGTTLTTYLVALASGSLTKAGGLMTLTAELDLGANFGIKSVYFSARGTPASAGAYRLENNTSVAWRNAANDGNLNLTVNASNALQFNSLPIVALALGAANTVLKMNSGGTAFEYGTLVNANIHASAAIAYSKLNLATSIVNADISASAAIAYSKLAALTSANIIVGSAGNVATAVAVTGDITLSNAGVAAIASGVIVNDDISASAAIAGSKLVAATNTVAGALTATAQNIGGVKTLYAADNLTTTYPFIIRSADGTKLASFGAYTANLGGGYKFFNSDGTDVIFQEASGITHSFLLGYTTSSTISTINSDLTTPTLNIVKRGNSQETAGNYFVIFHAGGSNCGGIQSNGTNTAAFFSISDERLKENITPLSGDLDKILSLNPSSFNFKNRKEMQDGFIAQNMQQVYPDSVVSSVIRKSEDDTDNAGNPEVGVEYLQVVGWDRADARIVSALKEFHQKYLYKIQELENRIDQLEG